MRIAALVQPVLRGRIREALAPGDRFLDVRSWDDLSDIARARLADMVVIDPAALGQPAVAEATDFASAFPVLPILVYTVASPSAAETLMKLSEYGVSNAMLHPFEGSPATVRRKLQHTRRDHLVASFLEKLSSRLGLLAPPLRSTIRRMFEKPEQFFAAGDVASCASLPLSAVYRALRSAKLGTPKRIFIVARLLNAYSRLSHSGDSVQRVAERLGYANTRVLGLHTRAALSLTPRHMRGLSESELAERLCRWIESAP